MLAVNMCYPTARVVGVRIWIFFSLCPVYELLSTLTKWIAGAGAGEDDIGSNLGAKDQLDRETEPEHWQNACHA
jgi:hypothetical protein